MKRHLIWVMLIAVVIGATSLRADQPPLVWAADSEGGSPYCSQDPDHPEKVIGYEVDLMNAIAEKMHRVAQFRQNSWDGLIPGLTAHDYDMVMNGVEITDDRKQQVNFSDPYYITFEQLAVRETETRLTSLADCDKYQVVVGTLKGTTAETILRKHTGLKLLTYDTQINMYQDLQIGRLDGVFLDYPAAVYGVKMVAHLKLVGGAADQIEYGIAIRKEDTALVAQVNAALAEVRSSGKLQQICEQWGLWNETTAKAMGVPWTGTVAATEMQEFAASATKQYTFMERLELYRTYLPILLQGAFLTLAISFSSMALAVVLGLVLALMRLYGPWPIRWLAQSFIEVIRGTPLLIQLYFIYYGLPNLFPSLQFPPFMAAVLGLGINYSTSEAENYRTGIQAVPRAQREAAEALGLNLFQTLRYVILPQALRLVIPPITTDFIALIKDSSLVSVITMVELTKVYGQLAATHYDYFGLGLVTAAIYFLLGLPFVRLAQWAETKFAMAR